MGKVWKNGAEEDKYIKKLIRNGKINKFTKPTQLKKDYPDMFGGFTTNVIRNHLNAVKIRCGCLLDGESDDDVEESEETEEQDEPTNVQEERTATKTLDDIVPGFQNVVHRNYPFMCEMFKDPENACDKVALVVAVPAGSQNVTFELSDDGNSATVKYNWAKAMFDMRELYSNMLAAKQLDIHHPRVLCIKNGLEKCRKHIDKAPEAALKIIFPVKVQTGGDTWSMSGVKKADGTQLLLAEFTGFIKDYHAKIRSVKFE